MHVGGAVYALLRRLPNHFTNPRSHTDRSPAWVGSMLLGPRKYRTINPICSACSAEEMLSNNQPTRATAAARCESTAEHCCAPQAEKIQPVSTAPIALSSANAAMLQTREG